MLTILHAKSIAASFQLYCFWYVNCVGSCLLANLFEAGAVGSIGKTSSKDHVQKPRTDAGNFNAPALTSRGDTILQWHPEMPFTRFVF